MCSPQRMNNKISSTLYFLFCIVNWFSQNASTDFCINFVWTLDYIHSQNLCLQLKNTSCYMNVG